MSAQPIEAPSNRIVMPAPMPYRVWILWVIPNAKLLEKGFTATTPPFPSLWLECYHSEGRVAIQVIRRPATETRAQLARFGWSEVDQRRAAEAAFSVSFLIWKEADGAILSPTEHVPILIDSLGAPIFRSDPEDYVLPCNIFAEPKDGKVPGGQIFGLIIAALHSLARMNCKNIELRPISEPKAPRGKHKLVAASVWHEIKISSVPKIQTTGRSTAPSGEIQKRAFWIRGHYADYRRGAGLFGNPKLKAIFWIPEHQIGNDELGRVVPSFKLL